MELASELEILPQVLRSSDVTLFCLKNKGLPQSGENVSSPDRATPSRVRNKITIHSLSGS